MNYKSDIEIAREAKIVPIVEIAKNAGISEEYLESYGKYKAKIDDSIEKELSQKQNGKLILVTAINPTPAGEGKTTTTIGLADGLNKIGKKAMIAFREPSLGPVFGIKGGATGGGHAQLLPMEDINLHFTGDLHAISTANNLIAAMIDNHIHHGNSLDIDTKRITWRRAMDMNDRQLRHIIGGIGGKTDGTLRQDGFDITAASELMAVFCMSKDLKDLKKRVSNMVIAFDMSGEPVTAGDIKAQGAVAALLKDAMKPNLVQTMEGTPALVHGGPFANIAHGCNTIIATKMGLKLSDYLITEAGFGADLGAEKFLDIKCRITGLRPNAVVLVATVRALKYNGGVLKADLNHENVDALSKGIGNLLKHIENISTVYKLPVVVAINKFHTDTEAELQFIRKSCEELGVNVALSDVWANGGAGGQELAEMVAELTEQPSEMEFAYDLEDSIQEKVYKVATKIYGADGIEFSPKALKEIEHIKKMGYDRLPICIAKNQYSLTDDPKKLGRPTGFKITVRDITMSTGAGFLVVLTGTIMKMPGLPKHPTAEVIDVEDDGNMVGLF